MDVPKPLLGLKKDDTGPKHLNTKLVLSLQQQASSTQRY